MNPLPAVVVAGQLTLAGQRPDAADLPEGPVPFGLRPDDIRLWPGDDAVIKVVEPAGSETYFQVEMQGKDLIIITKDRNALQPDDRVAVDLGSPKPSVPRASR